MDWLHVVILGVIEGLTEFLPISSTAHLTIAERLLGYPILDPDGRRPSQPHDHPDDPLWNDHPTFSEYFHGDTGEGLGASHQTGWSSLVAHLICTQQAQ